METASCKPWSEGLRCCRRQDLLLGFGEGFLPKDTQGSKTSLVLIIFAYFGSNFAALSGCEVSRLSVKSAEAHGRWVEMGRDGQMGMESDVGTVCTVFHVLTQELLNQFVAALVQHSAGSCTMFFAIPKESPKDPSMQILGSTETGFVSP
jgi:hypothetical protein